MWYQIESFLSPIFRQMNSLDRQQWIFVFVAALVMGFICMRGFGSRTKY
jgi:hypothetical protein